MKKIALVYTGMNIGGAQRVLIDISKNIKDFGMEAVVITDCGPMIEEIKNAGIKHYELPLKSKKPQNIIKSIKGLIKIINMEKIDVLHSHHRYVTMICNIIKPIIKIPVIHTEHNVFPNKNFINFRGENIIAVSNMVREHLVNIGVNADNIKVIQNGIYISDEIINYNLREELGLDEDCILIGVLARLAKEKGHELLINSIKKILLNNNKVKVIFIGDGPERVNLEKIIEELQIKESIILLGNRKDVNSIIDNINFFVLPSFYEGLPMSILEIMSKGKIVIATDVGGNKEVIINEKNGYLIEANNLRYLEDKIKFCIENIDNIKSMQEEAKKTIKEKFCIRRVVKDHKEYYDYILRKLSI